MSSPTVGPRQVGGPSPAAADAVLEYPNCDLCGSTSHRVLFAKKDTTRYWRAKCAEDPRLDADMAFTLVRCAECRHVFVRPRLAQPINADIYERLWRSREPVEVSANPFADYVCRQLAALGGRGRLLDFGCGWGSYVAAAAAAGWDAVGMEVDLAKVEFLRRHGLQAVHGDLSAGLLEPASFDAVIAQQVFEHLYDPNRYLREVFRILKPGGLLFMSVPNFGGWQAKVYGRSWHIISPIGHVRYFTRRTLSRFLADHGFIVVAKRYTKRFDAPLKEAAYQALVLLENVLQMSPHALSLFARKSERASPGSGLG